MDRASPMSLWDTTAAEPEVGAPFEADARCDVAIVGGGYTGLSTALHCAEKGLSAHVLEARHIGYGGSGRNVGLVNAGVWMQPAEVETHLGSDYGPRFLRRFADGPRTVFELIEKHQIRCEVTRTGTLQAAHAASGMRGLQTRHDYWRRLGENVEMIDRDRMAEMTGTKVYVGGLLDHRAGTINPMGYCRGLARAAQGAGARISTGVKVTALRRDGALWCVETERGAVTAKNVVLGTNAYTDELWPGLKNVFSMVHYFQLATEPLGPHADHILPGRQGLWDTAPIMFSARRDAAGRLIIGSMGRVIGSKDKGVSHRWARHQLRKAFPELGEVGFEEAWHGQIAMTPDHMPRIHQLAEGLWTPVAYNGRGITTGTIFGQAMAELLTGMDPTGMPLPVSDMAAVPRRGLTARVYDMAFTANQIWKGIR